MPSIEFFNYRYNSFGLSRKFWDEALVDQYASDLIIWRNISDSLGTRQTTISPAAPRYRRNILAAVEAFNRKTYRIPSMETATFSSSVYKYESGHSLNWHQDFKYDLQMLVNRERLRRFTAIMCIQEAEVGGEIVIKGAAEDKLKGEKLSKGDLLIFTSLHEYKVNAVQKGACIHYMMWVETKHFPQVKDGPNH